MRSVLPLASICRAVRFHERERTASTWCVSLAVWCIAFALFLARTRARGFRDVRLCLLGVTDGDVISETLSGAVLGVHGSSRRNWMVELSKAEGHTDKEQVVVRPQVLRRFIVDEKMELRHVWFDNGDHQHVIYLQHFLFLALKFIVVLGVCMFIRCTRKEQCAHLFEGDVWVVVVVAELKLFYAKGPKAGQGIWW